MNDIIIGGNTRKNFDEKKLRELANSIKEHGVIELILVGFRDDGKFDLIAGDRRVRASFLIGKVTIPARIQAISESKKLQLNLVENLQRETVAYMEMAIGIRRLRDEADLTVDEICKQLGKSTAFVYNNLKLTEVDPAVQEIFFQEEVTADVAITIARLDRAQQGPAAQALRRDRKDRRVSRKIALQYLADTFGTTYAAPKKAFIKTGNGNGTKNDYCANWKKYLVRFSGDQFEAWKIIVAGRTETGVLAEAVEIVMLNQISMVV